MKRICMIVAALGLLLIGSTQAQARVFFARGFNNRVVFTNQAFFGSRIFLPNGGVTFTPGINTFIPFQTFQSFGNIATIDAIGNTFVTDEFGNVIVFNRFGQRIR